MKRSNFISIVQHFYHTKDLKNYLDVLKASFDFIFMNLSL